MEFIPENAVVYLDTGSTTACLASLLRTKVGLTIITNSLSAANALIDSKCTVHVTGGQLNSLNMSFEGYQATNFLSTIKVEIAFLGTTGFDRHNGPTTIDFLDAQVKQTIIHNSKKNIVLTDSSKARLTAMSQYANWREIDYLISDDGLPERTIKQLKECTNIVIA